MASEKIQLFLSIGVVVFSVLAGIAWLRAATARVRAPDEQGFQMALRDDGSDRYSASGAYSACLESFSPTLNQATGFSAPPRL